MMFRADFIWLWKGISYIVEHSTAMMFTADFIWLEKVYHTL
jgi:hypothetical protein